MGHEREASRSGRRRMPAVVALVALSAGALAGCGLGEKAALEERITSAPARYDGTSIAGTVTVDSRLMAVPEGAAGGGGGGIGGFGAPAADAADQPQLPDDGVSFATATRAFVADTGTSRGGLVTDDGRIDVVFDDLAQFGRRAGVPDDDARPWVRLDLEDIDDGAGEIQPFDGRGADAVTAVNPAFLLDLAAGTLTGSIEEVGAETLGDVDTTHYEVNIALDKAFDDVRRDRYPEDRRETVDRLFELLGVDGDVHPGDVWLDAEGNLRRLSVALVQRPAQRVEFALVITLDITGIGVPFELVPPTPDEVLTVDSVVRFMNTVTGGSGGDDEIPPSVAATLGTVPTAPEPEPGAEPEPPADEEAS